MTDTVIRMDQAIWNTLHGRLLSVTSPDFGGNVPRFMVHVEPIYILLAPLFLVWNDVRLLLILQTVVLALGAFPVYGIARRCLGHDGLALAFAGAYLLFPSLQYANLFDFHGDTLAVLPLLLCVWFLIQRRWRGFWLCAVLAMMCKEWVSLLIAMMGLYLLVREKERRAGLAALAVGLLWFVVATQVVRGHFYGGYNELLPSVYTGIQGGAGGVVKTALIQPLTIIGKILTVNNMGMSVLLLLPVGFLALWRLDVLFITAPILLGLWLTGMDLRNHRNATLIPIILFSAILGAGALKGWFQRRAGGEGLWRRFHLANYERALAGSLTCFAVLSAVFVGPSPLSWKFWTPGEFLYWGNLHNFRVTAHDHVTDRFIRSIPPNVPISVSGGIAPHLTHRETCYSFPYPEEMGQVDYVLVDLLENHATPWIPREREREKIAALLQDERFALVAAQDGLLLFAKGKAHGLKQRATMVKEAHPQFKVHHPFGNRLELVGYDAPSGPWRPGQTVRLTYYWKVLPGFAKPFTSLPYCGEMESLDRDILIADVFICGAWQWRQVHLPTYLLFPPTQWKAGMLLREEMDWPVPDDLPAGEYTWTMGLYTAYEKFPIQVDDAHRVPGTGLIQVQPGLIRPQ